MAIPDAGSTEPPPAGHPPEDAPCGSDGSIVRQPYLAGLNGPQREAVETLDGPLLVLAGAGSGKTRVLTTRLAHLVTTGRTKPWQVLCCTFTNRAAREMKQRVESLLGFVSEGWWVGTFHALAARILRRHAELVDLTDRFTILDLDDRIRLIKQLLQAENIDEKRWPARGMAGVIDRWKDRGLTPDKVGPADRSDFATGRALDIYAQYQERLKILNACDFGDLLLHNLAIFQAHPDLLAEYRERFRYILIDEYQDTNVAQYLWLRLLAGGHSNICCVGDDDQSIYAWRGAEIGNILRFEKDFPGAKAVRLEQNYRSTGRILQAASGLIANNRGRLGKTLWTSGEDGEPVAVRGVWDGEQEARDIGDRIEDFQRAGESLDEVAILVRASFQMREFEERFITLGLPYRVIGGPRFYERMEIRDAMAYLRVIAQPADDLAFERIVNKPKRGLGDVAVGTVTRCARAQGVPMTEAAARICRTDALKPAPRRTLTRLMENFERWRGLLAEVPHPDVAGLVLDESGYTDMLRQDKSIEAPGRLDNLKELIAAMEDFETLEGFLEHVSLVMDAQAEKGDERVTIMTLHSAKGLEFDNVFLPGWEEGLFPHQRALDQDGASGLEEERRLAYVGLTRARRRVSISYAANRFVHGQWKSRTPSLFLKELPKQAIQVDSEQGLYGANWRARAALAANPNPMFDRDREARDGQILGSGLDRLRRAGLSESGPAIDGRSREAFGRGGKENGYSVGDRVFHRKFGYGGVTRSDGDKLDIAFDEAGEKKVMAAFVAPADRTD